MSVSARAVAPQLRSLVYGIVSAAGSIGAMIAAPIGQALANGYGWRIGVIGFVALAVIMIPSAWFAEPPPMPGGVDERSAGHAFVAALQDARFVVVAIAFLVCGLQLVFLTTHLPSYLALCGMDPMLSAEALGVIGGFNVLGSLFFGWAGGRWNKLVLLGIIYVMRSMILGVYFFWPPTSGSTLVYAVLMGFTWLGVVPLVSGAVAEMFGLRWQAMVQGIAFVGHQVGSFVGAFGGGLLYNALGSYDLAWRGAVAIGLIAGAVQIASALMRPTRPPPVLAPA